MSYTNNRKLPPYKLKGFALVPRPYDGLSSPYLSWETMMRDWPWTTWIKPSIDAGIALGANCIRLFGAQAAYGSLGYISKATYFANLTQAVSYCASQGVLCSSWACAPPHLNGLTGSTWAAVPQVVADYAAWFRQFPNVACLDLISEPYNGTAGTERLPGCGLLTGWSTPWTMNQAYTVMSNCVTAARAVAPDLPFSFGYSQNNDSSTIWSNADWSNFAIDYMNAHIYYSPSGTDPNPLFAAYPTKQLLLEEYGGPPYSNGAAAMATRLTADNTILARTQCSGGTYFGIARMDPSAGNDYGMYDATDDTATVTIGSVRSTISAAFSNVTGQAIPSKFTHRRRAI